MSWVIENSRTKGSSFVVLLMIANYAHKDGSGAYPGFETIARDSRITIRQVTNIIKVLERSGELIVEHKKGPNGTNRYTVNMRQKRLPMEIFSIGKTQAANFQRSVRNQKIEPTPPLPPAEAGEEKVFSWYGESIGVRMGRKQRLFSKLQWDSMTGLAACYLIERIKANGFEARIIPAETKSA